MKKMRLDKYLVHTGVGTRSEVQKLIKKKQVTVDGVAIAKAEAGIDPDVAKVCVRGEEIVYEAFYHFIMNKPTGVITATEDPVHETVLDLMSKEDQNKGVAPVGRLDKDTEGLLILTSDGKLNHSLLSPKKHVDKVYFAKVEGIMEEADIAKFREGVVIGEYKCMPAELRILKADTISEIEITIKEGKFHQIKRMVHAVGKEVIYLERIKMGGLVLPTDIERGSYRKLTAEELEKLKGAKNE